MTKRMLTGVAVAAAVLLASAGNVWADVYFSESFDNMAVGTTLTDSTPTTNGGIWRVTSSATVVADPAGGSGTCLENTVAAGDATHVRFYPSAPITEAHMLSFDAYMSANAASNVYLSLRRINGVNYTDDVYCNVIGSPSRAKTAVVNYMRDGSTDVMSDSTDWSLPIGTWLSFEFAFPEATPSAFAYSMKIKDRATGQVLYNAQDIQAKGVNNPTYQWRMGGAAAGTFYVDNIQLATVPEPMTMAMVVAGALLVGAKKRR